MNESLEDTDGAAANDNDVVAVTGWHSASGVTCADSSVDTVVGVRGGNVSSVSPHQGVSDAYFVLSFFL